MRFASSLVYSSTLAVSLVCFNLQTITSNQETPGPFDIPWKASNDSSSSSTVHRELHNLRSGAQSNGFNIIDEIEQPQQQQAPQQIPMTPEEIIQARKLRTERINERREKAKKIIREHQPEVGQMQRMTAEDIRRVYGNAVKDDPLLEKEDNKWLRNLGTNSQEYLADVGEEYDSWAQGYRMLGGFIDCDNHKDEGSGDKNGGGGACSRWMMWAAYINPNYQGGGRSEYFSDNNYGYTSASSSLDCHKSNTEWQLLGVYRQEFYQFIEQISKHLWAIDDYEYVVALAGLAYMTDDDCYGVGYDDNGNYVYAGVQPTYGGSFEMALYTDNKCLSLDESGSTFDDFGLSNDMDLGSKDDGTLSDDSLSTLYGYWKNTQEYTLSQLNDVYEEFKYCTLCMDYPTYQDGYFIGDYGTDDDDLINQCWKFHSHDSFVCESTCLALGDAQGTITHINYKGRSYGQSWDGSSGSSSSKSSSGSSSGHSGYSKAATESNFAKFKANAYMTLNGVLFIATFLAFSVARGNRDGINAPEKKKSLLSKEERRAAKLKSPRSASSRRSKSSSKSKKSSMSVGSRTSKKSSTSRSKSNQRSRSRSKSASRRTGTYA